VVISVYLCQVKNNFVKLTFFPGVVEGKEVVDYCIALVRIFYIKSKIFKCET
jgi:hypothetical protein